MLGNRSEGLKCATDARHRLFRYLGFLTTNVFNSGGAIMPRFAFLFAILLSIAVDANAWNPRYEVYEAHPPTYRKINGVWHAGTSAEEGPRGLRDPADDAGRSFHETGDTSSVTGTFCSLWRPSDRC